MFFIYVVISYRIGLPRFETNMLRKIRRHHTRRLDGGWVVKLLMERIPKKWVGDAIQIISWYLLGGRPFETFVLALFRFGNLAHTSQETYCCISLLSGERKFVVEDPYWIFRAVMLNIVELIEIYLLRLTLVYVCRLECGNCRKGNGMQTLVVTVSYSYEQLVRAVVCWVLDYGQHSTPYTFIIGSF